MALAYLTHESFQTYILAGLPLLLTAFSMSYTHFDPSQASDPDVSTQLRQVRNAFVSVLADISALPDFIPGSAQGGPSLLQNPIFQTLQSWLHGPPAHANLQTAACLALGNLARSDITCITFVRDAQIQQPLINLLVRCTSGETTPNAQLTHAVLSFLKNLAIPAANKPTLGQLLESNILPKLWSTWGDTQPQTQFAAVSLARLLLVGSPPNVRRICAPLSADPDSPAHDRSNLHILTALFDRSDAEPTKMEVARAVATVCRTLHSSPVSPVLPDEPSHDHNNHYAKRQKHSSHGDESSIVARTEMSFSPNSTTPFHSPTGSAHHSPSGANNNHYQTPTQLSPISTSSSTSTTSQTRRARFYEAHDLAIPLSFLIKQTRFPALRSEAWFVLALMCRSPDGAKVVQNALQSFEACRALVESITGRDMADGHDLLVAASSSPAAEGQEDGAGNARVNPHAGDTGLAGIGIEGLGLGSLEPQSVDPATQANMARIDRENGLCMIAELIRSHKDDLLPLRRNIYEQLLQTGGELVLHSRAEVGGSSYEAGIPGIVSPGQYMQQQQQQQQHVAGNIGMNMGPGMMGDIVDGSGGVYTSEWNNQQ